MENITAVRKDFERFTNILAKNVQEYLEQIKPYLIQRQLMLARAEGLHTPEVTEYLNNQLAYCEKKILEILDLPKEITYPKLS